MSTKVYRSDWRLVALGQSWTTVPLCNLTKINRMAFQIEDNFGLDGAFSPRKSP